MAYSGDPLAAAGVREGDTLAGKYRVERILGIGGMGVVVAAQHLQLGTRVAIKFLLPELLSNRESVTRFANEARRAVQIRSEHVARVHDVGTLENGAPYMVMEFLDGGDLSAFLKHRGPLPFDEAVDFVLQAMEAIAEAHALGIVHRDLKPANLFCTRGPDGKLWIKVLDFGISKATGPAPGAASFSRTATASLMGSPFYMSPEQMESSGTVDARTDIWALGVIVFELLTGRVPFHGDTIPEVCSKIASRPAPLLRDFRPDAPEALQTVVLRCLEKDRERRYRNAAELALALQPFAPRRGKASVERITDIIQAAGLSATALSVPPSPVPSGDGPRVETMPPLGKTTPGPRGAHAKLALLGGAAILVLGGAFAALLFVKMRRVPPPLSYDPPPPKSAEAAQACEPDAVRCAGPLPQRCTAGHWVSGAVTAGQCGAVCTPGSSPQCDGSTPQSCGSAGQWEDGAACSARQVCQEGACVETPPMSPPPKPALSRPAAPPRTPQPAASPTRPPPPPPKPDCDPNYVLDARGEKHFKPECFGVSDGGAHAP